MIFDVKYLWLEFSYFVESFVLIVEEVMDVCCVLVKVEMEKFLQNKEFFSSLKKGKICCCCWVKFLLFLWLFICFFCKRVVCIFCSIKMKMFFKKFVYIFVYILGFESFQRVLVVEIILIQRKDIF